MSFPIIIYFPLFAINGETISETNINEGDLKFMEWENKYVKIYED